MADGSKNVEVPKVYLRPKSANDSFFGGPQDTKHQRETLSKSALGSYENERVKKVYCLQSNY